MASLLFTRKVLQMTVISVLLVGLITLIVVLSLFATASESSAQTLECQPIIVDYEDRDDGIRLFWTTNPCAAKYAITHVINGEEGLPIVVSHPVDFVQLTRHICSKNQIIVSTIALEADKKFDDVYINITIPIIGDGSVQNLQYNSDRGLVEWVAPNVPAWCDLKFFIEFSNDLDDILTSTINTSYDFPVYPCTTNHINVTTQIVIFEKNATSTSLVHAEPVPDDIKVRDLHFDADSSRFVWEPPENTEHCDMTYMVNFTNEFQPDGHPMNTTTNEYFEILACPCSTNRIEVTTSIHFESYVYSEPEIKVHEEPINRTLPTHIETSPSEAGADVVWNILPEGPTVCNVIDFYFTISEENETYPVDQISIKDYLEQIGNLSYSFDLEEGLVYDYRVCFEFEQDPDVPLCTKSIIFPTLTLRQPDIEINLETSSYIGVSWTTNESYDRFITSHTVSIEPRRTHHFTPSYCNINWNLTKEVESGVPPNVSEVLFEDAYPSFLYNVMVITHFDDLGVDRVTLEEDVVTIETDPGYLDIEASYSYEPSTEYNVTLKAKWGIPCDVNGVVQSFAYTLIGELQSDDDTVICSDVVIGSGVVDLSDENLDKTGIHPIYEIEIPDLLPFLTYSLNVTTHLRDYSSTTRIQLEEVPPAYTSDS